MQRWLPGKWLVFGEASILLRFQHNGSTSAFLSVCSPLFKKDLKFGPSAFMNSYCNGTVFHPGVSLFIQCCQWYVKLLYFFCKSQIVCFKLKTCIISIHLFVFHNESLSMKTTFSQTVSLSQCLLHANVLLPLFFPERNENILKAQYPLRWRTQSVQSIDQGGPLVAVSCKNP